MGLLLRQHRIILPKCLREFAIRKAHQMGHIGMSGLKRQLRSHFEFPFLDKLVEKEVSKCADCQLFIRKPNKSHLVPVYVPKKVWDYVSIDFFCPTPNGDYVLVVQDLCTK